MGDTCEEAPFIAHQGSADTGQEWKRMGARENF